MTVRFDGSGVTEFESVAALAQSVGATIGTSRWFEIDQARIDQFAAVTEDQQWIHVDPVRAAKGPFGATVAHGYLTLALASPIVADVLHVNDLAQGINYGLDKVRFPSPVAAGSRVRGTLTLTSATPIDGGVQAHFRLVVEVAGQDRPGCVAELVIRLYGNPRPPLDDG